MREFSADSPTKRYLGDSVYVDLYENGLILTTENGVEASNTIVLEPEVLTALSAYLSDYFDAIAG